MKICQYLLLHMKIICWRFHIKILFAFWDKHTWHMRNIYLQIFRKNRIWQKLTYLLRNSKDAFGLLKACVCYFLSNFYFFINWLTFKNYEKCFLFYLKSSFRSRDIQIFVIFPLLFHTFQIQKGKWEWNNLWCCKLACINLQI